MNTHAFMPARAAWAATAQAKIAGRCAGKGVEAKLKCLRACYRDHPVLERIAGINAVVLQKEIIQTESFAQVECLDERSVAGADIYNPIAVNWEEVAITPDRRRAGGDAFAGYVRPNSVIVVGNFKGPKTKLAYMVWLDWIAASTLATLQAGCKAHLAILLR